MLGKRVATAVVLIVLFLLALFFLPALGWGLLLAAFTLGGSLEWARLSGFRGIGALIYGAVTTGAGAGLLWAVSNEAGPGSWAQGGYWLSLIFWAVWVPWALARRVQLASASQKAIVGWIVLLPAVAAMFQLRAVNPWLLLGFMATVWISDTAAFFVGRRFGRHKLAPAVSPGKTWEGVAGALVAVALYGLAWGHWGLGRSDPMSLAAFAGFLLALAVLGVLGDLFESAMKRSAGVKDSGTVLPGHGGILDRVDALTSTLPLAALATHLF